MIAYGPIRMKSPWVLLKSVIFLEFPSHYHRLKPKTKYSSPILTILTIGVAAGGGGAATCAGTCAVSLFRSKKNI